MRQSKIAIVGAPLDLGASRRGVDMGPSALRLAGLNSKLPSLGYEVEDLGNLAAPQQESVSSGPETAKYLPQIAKACEKIAHTVAMLWLRANSRWCWAGIIPSRSAPLRALLKRFALARPVAKSASSGLTRTRT